jgi:hypothetical protein
MASEARQFEKDFAGILIPGPRNQVGVDHGILNVGVPPVLHQAHVRVLLQPVRGDGVLQHVEVSFPIRNFARSRSAASAGAAQCAQWTGCAGCSECSPLMLPLSRWTRMRNF